MEKFSSVPPKDENDFADYLVLHGAVLREETCCKWLKRLYQVMQKRECSFATLPDLYNLPEGNDDR